jgi:diaminopimelate epimerase
MIKEIKFTKMVASGNDFVVVKEADLLLKSSNLRKLSSELCDRKFGVGADGLLLIGKSRKADIRMRIFNADGSEAEMCGNGARCAALFASRSKKISIETMAGIINAEVGRDTVKINLTGPKGLKLGIPIKVNGRLLRVNFINTGVPHAIIFVSGIEGIDVDNLGREVRYYHSFAPRGTNVNFVEALDKDTVRIRTYERGVEGETLACGTGSTASALIFALKNNIDGPVKVITQSKEVLKVYFSKEKSKFKDVWLEGRAKIVYKGEYNV